MTKFFELILPAVKAIWTRKVLVGVLIVGTAILVIQFLIYRGEDEVFRKILFVSVLIELFNFLVGFLFYLLKEEIFAYFFWISALSIAIVSIYYVKFVVFSLV